MSSASTARLRIVDDFDYYDELAKAGPDRFQAGYIGWAAGIPSPAEYFESFLDFLATNARYSDPAIAREVRRALELQQTDLLAASEVWTRVDRMLVDKAYVVPLYNVHAVAFVSDRVGNYQLHPFYFYLLDQMWVR